MPLLTVLAAVAALAVAPPPPGDSLRPSRDSVRASRDTTPRPWRLLAVPALTSQPETGFAGAFIAYAVHTPADTATRPAQYEVGLQATQKRQTRLFVEWDRWSAGNRWRVQGTAEYRVYPLPFYGTGPVAPAANEEIYEPRGVIALLNVQRRLSRGWFVLGGARLSALTIRERAADGLLAPDTVPGADGARLVQWRTGLLYDTRDDVLTPRAGAFVTFGLGAAVPGLLGGDWSYGRATLDARSYRTVGPLTLAAQAVAEGLTGRAPFDDLPMLGTKGWMRGYALGRFRDRSLAAVQVEGRLQLTRRLAGAAWVGGGGVAPTFDRLRSDQLLPTVGFGGRWGLFSNSRAQLRADLAFGRDGSALYLNLNEAF
jgi:hypothetical protein